MIVFIIAGGGAFKQVLVDSGVGQYISHLNDRNYTFAVIDVLDCRGAVAYRLALPPSRPLPPRVWCC